MSVSLVLVVWLASGTPAAVATARLDRLPAAMMVWLIGPFAWCAWAFARHHQAAAQARAWSRSHLSRV